MNLLKHDTSSLIGSIERKALEDSFAEALTLLRDAKTVYNTIRSLEHKTIDFMDATDKLEDYTGVDVHNLDVFRVLKSSLSETINKYLERVFIDIDVYSRTLNAAVDCMFALQPNEIEYLEQKAYNVVSGMTFFCSFEFDMLGIISSAEEGAEAVDEVVQVYCRRTGETALTIAKEIQTAMKEFKINFDVFDAFPELEEQFFNVMGPNITAVDPVMLTMELVQAVINGEITPELLIKEMQEVSDDAVGGVEYDA